MNCGKAEGCLHQALNMGMQVCCMLMGEMACPTDKVKRMKLAEEEVTLQATVQGHLVSKKTKWYIMAELEQ